jgi:hypothetical protein
MANRLGWQSRLLLTRFTLFTAALVLQASQRCRTSLHGFHFLCYPSGFYFVIVVEFTYVKEQARAPVVSPQIKNCVLRAHQVTCLVLSDIMISSTPQAGMQLPLWYQMCLRTHHHVYGTVELPLVLLIFGSHSCAMVWYISAASRALFSGKKQLWQ